MRIRIVDAFTDRPFAGNPAAVCLLEATTSPDEEWMRQVAARDEPVRDGLRPPRRPDGEAGWALRWFTPVAEVTLCGHATLATAHVLRTHGPTPAVLGFTTLAAC